MISSHFYGTLAYIDPGAGAMLLQWVIAAIFGGGIIFRRTISAFFRRILGRYNRKKKDKEDVDSKSVAMGSNECEGVGETKAD